MSDVIEAAVSTCSTAQLAWANSTIDERSEVIATIREGFFEANQRLAHLEATETGRGRFDDKMIKNDLALRKTPGPELLKVETFAGANGMTNIGYMPTGVWISIAPCTNPVTTVMNNIISFLSGGNGVVFQPHPDAEKCTSEAVQVFRSLFPTRPDIQNLVCVLTGIRSDKIGELVNAPGSVGVLVTGGHGVVQAVMAHCSKRVICAGPGNPPCYVDESYRDVLRAANLIAKGAALDNNMLCTDEKAVIVHSKIYKTLLKCFEQTGHCIVYTDPNIIAKFDVMLKPDCSGPLPHLVGKSPIDLLRYLKIKVPPDHVNKEIRLIILGLHADPKSRTLWTEQMMPVLPVIKVDNFDDACNMCSQVEGGRFHSASIWCQDVHRIQDFSQRMHVANLVINGPIYSGLGLGGQGDTSFSIAGWTGEGYTDCRTFSRQRRLTFVSKDAHQEYKNTHQDINELHATPQ